MTNNSNNDRSGWGGVSLKNKNKPHTHKRGAEKKDPTAAKGESCGKSDEDFFFFPPVFQSFGSLVGFVSF